MTNLNVLVVGASGFVGRRVAVALGRRGHRVLRAGRDPLRLSLLDPFGKVVRADLARDGIADWSGRLDGIDAVVNAAGALRGDLAALHADGPRALFETCAAARIPRVVQVSALGAGQHPGSPFLATKSRGDAVVLHHAGGRSGWHVVRPSLVIGRGGRSTATFSALAAAPRPIRLGAGTWHVQPIHVDDLAEVVADLVEGTPAPAVVEAAGPDVLSTDTLTALLRAWLGLPSTEPFAMSLVALRLAAKAGRLMPGASLTAETLALLRAGNRSDAVPDVVRARARPLREALAASPSGPGDLAVARGLWLRPVLAASLAAVWIGSGAASLFVGEARADALLAGLGVSGAPASAVVLAGAGLDLALGAAMLIPAARRPALKAQLATVAAYTVLATLIVPALWLDPFAPLLKNAAVVAATLSLLGSED